MGARNQPHSSAKSWGFRGGVWGTVGAVQVATPRGSALPAQESFNVSALAARVAFGHPSIWWLLGLGRIRPCSQAVGKNQGQEPEIQVVGWVPGFHLPPQAFSRSRWMSW